MSNEEEIKNALKHFINVKNIDFKIGKRNTDSVALAGYALFLGIKNFHELEDLIDIPLTSAALDEFERVFHFAKRKNYGKYWEGKTF